MQLDVEAGRVFELESLIGVIGARARSKSSNPTADMVYAALLPVNLKAQKAAGAGDNLDIHFHIGY